jgi:hypothetical protein
MEKVILSIFFIFMCSEITQKNIILTIFFLFCAYILSAGTFSLPKDASAILPFNFGIRHYFFFAPDGIKQEYCLDLSDIFMD